jgi:5'-nucleotidase
VLPSRTEDDENDGELRIAFDFDGVIADDESETVFKRNNNVDEFHAHETERVAIPHQPGPLADLFRKLSLMQQMEEDAQRRPGLQENPAHRHHHGAQRAGARARGDHAEKLGRVGQRNLLPGRDGESARAGHLQAAHVLRRPIEPPEVPGGNIPMVHIPSA